MNTIHEIGLQNQQDFWAMLYLYVGRSILDVCGRRGEKAVRRAVREMAREKGKKLASSYREKGVNIISVAMDAPGDVISALSGKLGRLEGVTAKTVYAPAGSV